MFCDTAKVSLKAGKGGDGAVSFRREIYINKGGPDGGNGGKGGSIIFVADKDTNTLIDFRFNPILTAEDGGNGSGTRSAGRSGKNLIVEVPIGTVVKRDGKIIADLTHDREEAVIAKGGDGGFGNAHFKSSVRQTPIVAEVGEPGEEFWLQLELKVLADVGLLGYPSVGKSSILRKVSKAQPEVAAYHFTTLTPVLGVVTISGDRSFVLADIPGLIEGASEGVGLGHNFLRHVERTNILIHVLDVSGMEGRDPKVDFDAINEELRKYSEKLANKKQIVALNKIDMVFDDTTIPDNKKYFEDKGYEVFLINALSGEGLPELMERAYYYVENYEPEPEATDDTVVYEAKQDVEFVITRGDDAAFYITGKRIERLVAMTNLSDDQSLRRFQRIWRFMELDAKLKEKGCKDGDEVVIGDQRFTFQE